MEDIEIAQSIEKEDIRKIGKKIGLKEDDLLLYGTDKAKIKKAKGDKNGKLFRYIEYAEVALGLIREIFKNFYQLTNCRI